MSQEPSAPESEEPSAPESEEPSALDSHSVGQEPDPISFAEFLEDVPSNQVRKISDLKVQRQTDSGRIYHELRTPPIQVHCASDICNGIRVFRNIDERKPTVSVHQDFTYDYLTYRYSNCRKTVKIFSIAAKGESSQVRSGECFKLGEKPAYGPPTPSRLISLIGPDREIFLKGRQCENLGLGIGAFVYYRRVVENQKNRIIGNITEVAEKLSSPVEMISALQNALTENQFKKSMELAKNAIPQSLLINGHNPLTLLHSALSEGLHSLSDERCLELAHDIRIVLGDFAERLAQALKDERELNEALSRLMRRSDT